MDIKEVVKEFKKFKPKAIALWGSYGMGLNDKFTHDIDIAIYVNKLPTQSSKKPIFSKLSDSNLKLPWEGDFFIKNYEIYEIKFIQCNDIEQKIKDLKKGKNDFENNIAVFIRDTKIIYDTNWLIKLKNKIKKYPNKLFKNNFNENLTLAFRKIHHYDRALNKRAKPLWAQYIINRGTNYLIRTIFAANKTYYGKDKWLEYEINKFKIKPKNFEKNLIKLLKSRDISYYKKLVYEVYNTYKKHYPKEVARILEVEKSLQKIDAQIELSKESNRFLIY
ncbi:hypothetical protein CL617_03885 [archaeon]|nr:hypothetical protein [archaeon]|tara:strand:- start:19948 stop:20778 length:831 start_codon:yes stop_codon:yes gene_type:complete